MKRTKISLLATLLIFTIINLNGAWYANWPPPPQPPPLNQESDSVNKLIVDGASNMLRAYSLFILIINESEISLKGNFNFLKTKAIIEDTIDILNSSKAKYTKFLSLIEEMQISNIYYEELEKLKKFEYDNMTSSRNLHPLIMERVKHYLQEGNLIYFFEKISKDIEDIEKRLNQIKYSVQNNIIPDKEILRSLYQNYTDCMLFGYYASLVFSEIKE